MPITHAQIVNAKPREKPYRLFDGRGLYVEISPSGGGGGDSSTASMVKRSASPSVSIPM
jgi:hypothetical protein